MMNFLKIAEKIKEAKSELEAVQQAQAAKVFTEEAGGGMVKVRMQGNRRLIAVEIDPQLLQTAEQETLQDLFMAATNAAIAATEEACKEDMKNSSAGFLSSIPGVDLSKLF